MLNIAFSSLKALQQVPDLFLVIKSSVWTHVMILHTWDKSASFKSCTCHSHLRLDLVTSMADTLPPASSVAPAPALLDATPLDINVHDAASLDGAADNGEPESELDTMEALLEDSKRRQELHAAVKSGDLAVVRPLLDNYEALVRDEDSDGKLPIHCAAHRCHDEMVALLLAHGADIDAWDRTGKSQLVCEAERGNLAAVTFLLDRGADVNRPSLGGGVTALLAAAEHGHVDIVQLLLNRGASVDAADEHNRTPLSAAAKSGHVACVQLLADNGAAVKTKQKLGRTPLLLAASNGHVNVVADLLDRDPTLIKDQDGSAWTPLHAAAGNNRELVVELLLAKSASVDERGPHGATPLYLAAQRGYVSIVALLIKHGAAVDATQEEGKTPLIAATERGSVAVVKLLLDAGASVHDHESSTDSPLLVAATKGFVEIVTMLVAHDAALVNKAGRGGTTPLMAAARYRRTKIAELLVNEGARIDDTQEHGRTALMLAISNRHVDVARLLVERSASVNVVDAAGWSPLHVAAGTKQPGIVQLLIDRGASVEVLSNDGTSPLDLAIKKGASAVVDVLVKAQERVRGTPPDYTALFAAAGRFGRLTVLNLLRRHVSLDACASCSDGETVLLWLVRWDFSGYFTRLLRDSVTLLTTTTTEATDAPVVGATPLFTVVLASLDVLCRGSSKSEPMHASVVARLIDISATLSVPSAAQWSKTFGAIVFRFARQLLQYKRRSTIARFIAADATLSNLRDLHEEIDNFLALLKVPPSADVHKRWRDTLQAAWVDQCNEYRSVLTDRDRLAAALERQEDRDSVVAHLTSLLSSRSSGNEKDKAAVQSAIRVLVGADDSSCRLDQRLPAWFVNRYDIEFKGSRLVRTNQFVKGQWLRSTVMLGTCDLALKEFKDAATAWKRLGHPNVMDLFGAVHVGQPRLFICSEHQTLREYLATHRQPSAMFEKLHEAAQGVLFLHKRGIVHGRLTTDCLLVGDDKKAKIGGLDRVDASVKRDPSGCKYDATAWTAPELMCGEAPSFASDTYALGVCILDILTMTDPWRVRFGVPLRQYLLSSSANPPPGVTSRSHWNLIKEMCALNQAQRVSMGYVVPHLGYFVSHAEMDEHCKPQDAPVVTTDDKVRVCVMRWSVLSAGAAGVDQALTLLLAWMCGNCCSLRLLQSTWCPGSSPSCVERSQRRSIICRRNADSLTSRKTWPSTSTCAWSRRLTISRRPASRTPASKSKSS